MRKFAAMKKIIHVDMDQFFAAVELLDHPELKEISPKVLKITPRELMITFGVIEVGV